MRLFLDMKVWSKIFRNQINQDPFRVVKPTIQAV